MKFFIVCIVTLFSPVFLFANKNVEWNLVMSWTSTHTPLSSPSFKIAKLVKEMTNEKFIIKVSGKERVNSSLSTLEMVQQNKYQIGHSSSSNWKEKNINTIWFTGIPFGLTYKEQYTWFFYGGGLQYMQKVYDELNVLAFPGGDMGTQMGGWFKKEINSISDLKGLNVNTTGIVSEILSMHGVTHNEIPNSLLVDSFENGKLDVINGISPSLDIKKGYHKIALYYYTSWDRPSSQMQFLINKEAFNKLSPQYQKILITAMKTVSHEVYYENFQLSSLAWNKMKRDYPNIKVKSLPSGVLKELNMSTFLVLNQYSKENKLFKEIFESQKRFFKRARNWTLLEEYSYINSLEEKN